MKKIKQNIEVNSNILEFHEKMLLMPLIEMFVTSAKTNECIELKVSGKLCIQISPYIAKKTYKLLCDIIDEDYQNFEFDKDRQKLTIGVIPPNASKLECVKILKNILNIGLKDAKDIVDNCPITIDLSKYNIDESKYEELVRGITDIGIAADLKR